MPVMPELPKHILPLFEKFCADREKLSFENGYARGKADGASEVMNGLRTISAFLPTNQPQVGPQLAPPIMLSEKPQKPAESEPDFDISDLLQDVFGDDWDEEDKDALIQLAMVSVQEAYKSKGKDASAILNRLRMLADDDELFRDVVSGKQQLGWEQATSRRGNVMAVGVNDERGSHAGKKLYGAQAQRVLGQNTARGKRDAFRGKVTPKVAKQDWDEFDTDLDNLTMKELKELRTDLASRLSSSAEVKGHKGKKKTWTDAIREMIKGAMVEPEAKAESKAEPTPKEEPVADVASDQEEPKASTDNIKDFSQRLYDIAYSMQDGKFGDNKVFISKLYDEAKKDPYFSDLSMDKFKKMLVMGNREDTLGLSRADLVQAMNKDDVANSRISHLGGEYNFLLLDDKYRGEQEEPDFAPASDDTEPAADLQAEPKDYDENKVKLHKKISQIIDDDIQPMDAELMEKLSERYGVPKREVLRTYRQVMGHGADVSRDEIVNPADEVAAEQPATEPVKQVEPTAPTAPAKPKGLTARDRMTYPDKRAVENLIRKEQKVPDHVLEHYGLGKKETPVELPATPDAVKRELKASAEGKRQASTEGIANESEKQKQDRLQKESVEKELSSLIGTELIDDVMIDAIAAKTKAKPTAIKKMVKDMTEIAIDDELTEAHAEGNVDDVLLDDLSERFGIDRKTLDSKYKKVKSGKGLKEIKAVDAPIEDKAELDKYDTGTFVGDNAKPEMERLAREKAGIDESEVKGLPKRDNTPDGISPEQRDRLKKFTDANNAINVGRSKNELAELPAKVQDNVANIKQLDPLSEDYRDNVLDLLGAMSRVDRAKVASALKIPATAITMDAIADAIVKQNEKRAKKGSKSKVDAVPDTETKSLDDVDSVSTDNTDVVAELMGDVESEDNDLAEKAKQLYEQEQKDKEKRKFDALPKHIQEARKLAKKYSYDQLVQMAKELGATQSQINNFGKLGPAQGQGGKAGIGKLIAQLRVKTSTQNDLEPSSDAVTTEADNVPEVTPEATDIKIKPHNAASIKDAVKKLRDRYGKDDKDRIYEGFDILLSRFSDRSNGNDDDMRYAISQIGDVYEDAQKEGLTDSANAIKELVKSIPGMFEVNGGFNYKQPNGSVITGVIRGDSSQKVTPEATKEMDTPTQVEPKPKKKSRKSGKKILADNEMVRMTVAGGPFDSQEEAEAVGGAGVGKDRSGKWYAMNPRPSIPESQPTEDIAPSQESTTEPKSINDQLASMTFPKGIRVPRLNIIQDDNQPIEKRMDALADVDTRLLDNIVDKANLRHNEYLRLFNNRVRDAVNAGGANANIGQQVSNYTGVEYGVKSTKNLISLLRKAGENEIADFYESQALPLMKSLAADPMFGDPIKRKDYRDKRVESAKDRIKSGELTSSKVDELNNMIEEYEAQQRFEDEIFGTSATPTQAEPAASAPSDAPAKPSKASGESGKPEPKALTVSTVGEKNGVGGTLAKAKTAQSIDTASLKSKTRPQLLEIAKTLDIPGYKAMTPTKLIAAIESAQGADSTQ